MFKHLLKKKTLTRAVFDERWAWLVRADTDLGSVTTWDPNLRRNKRILVPVDVQAYVAHESNPEALVPVTGGPGDPVPFAEGSLPEPGIHLHWALPDALLRGAESSSGGELEMTELPDCWVVIRSLFPVGITRPMLRGWVVDAKKGSLTPLDLYRGVTNDSEDKPAYDRLDGTVGGSPLWTASYSASAGRFGFHDALEDLPELKKVAKDGFERNVATYVVAGWYTDIEKDPLGVSRTADLLEVMAELGWHLDPEAEPPSNEPDLAVLERLLSKGQFKHPTESTPTKIVARGREESFTYADIAPEMSLPVDKAANVLIAQKPPRFLSLFHGMITGVPVETALPGVDERPRSESLAVSAGFDTDDLVTGLGAETLGSSLSQRRAAEMLAAAFTSDLIDRVGTQDGLRDIAEREHDDMFSSLPGKPLPQARFDHLRAEDSASVNATTVGRKGRARLARQSKGDNLSPRPKWRDKVVFREPGAAPKASELNIQEKVVTGALKDRRTVERPAPRIFIPQPPSIAIKGARPSLRHHFDGLYDDEGRLRCRYPNEAVKGIKGVVKARDLVPTLGSGAVPPEVLTVVREAMVLNPYCSRWLANAAADKAENRPQYQHRIEGEMLRLFSSDGRYDGSGEYTLSESGVSPQAPGQEGWRSVAFFDTTIKKQAAAELARASYLEGFTPSPLGVTAWRQPWVPLWLEWRVELEGSTRLSDWALDDLELIRRGDSADVQMIEIIGRSPISRGLGTALHTGIERWIKAEQEREATGDSLTASEQRSLESLADFLEPLDLASASLDGIREQLLGLNYSGGFFSTPGADDRPEVVADPLPLFGGTLTFSALRLVDAFGRVLNVPTDNIRTTTPLEIADAPSSIKMSARIQSGARWLFRLVDPACQGEPSVAPEAFVNQLEPDLAVNPVAGFLLPDHIDESLEAFDIQGNPLGQISHHELTNAVRWEPAPGRPLPPGAGPMAELPASATPLGKLVVGVIRSDVRQRDGELPQTESSLTALLRAIDTTLWTVDTYSTLGSGTVAGLVGRPIAVVKATLRLDIPDDLDDVRVDSEATAEARRAAFDALRDESFPVRLGDLQRSDDSLLGYFLDDDYDHFHLVDKSIAALARDSGRRRGQLGLLGQVHIPDVQPLDHPYLFSEDTLYIQPGQARQLTLLMLPAGRVHLTSGILPRKALALNDAWINQGLKRVIPSVRVGPVLVDPEEIRLPKVNLLGEKQQFTRRTGPLTWRDDPIVSASQSALLPRMPHEFQEGWIRIIEEDES
ncbi:hypothetical protein [Marinobacter changyiensis]|uniref:hypothetical protein n=1 Tax=Marinobacter changyiensis TaxID=2604091 RepID=UPI0012655ECE|nr:hypothetical protein [Marinobacter changyiensis]